MFFQGIVLFQCYVMIISSSVLSFSFMASASNNQSYYHLNINQLSLLFIVIARTCYWFMFYD